ncbi:hypothetical protein IEO21_03249 [Rhodonia placenta]|uniref:Uncharacterized protein n=1 Tax=Rhodonia placenta TaxID=104341 RepID=A0A8H7P5Z0_9APHY|nr:hypothetical protein IEO21_03249 [Postia placenta]
MKTLGQNMRVHSRVYFRLRPQGATPHYQSSPIGSPHGTELPCYPPTRNQQS